MSTGSTDITVPGGCKSIAMESDGSVHHASPSGTISVPDEYMSELSASNAVRNGILSTGRSFGISTKRGMRCEPCHRTWQAWTKVCHVCHQPTTPDDRINHATPSDAVDRF